MSTNESSTLRKMIVDAMSGHHSHIDFDSVVEDFPPELRGVKPKGAPHTAWQLLEHIRIAQWDILEFSRNPQHKSPKWPDGYWPKTEAPPSEEAWNHSVKAYQNDLHELAELIMQSGHLFKPIEHGQGQTLLREALLIANHNSYHLGQLAFLKKMLL
jgi:DinB superfamily